MKRTDLLVFGEAFLTTFLTSGIVIGAVGAVKTMSMVEWALGSTLALAGAVLGGIRGVMRYHQIPVTEGK